MDVETFFQFPLRRRPLRNAATCALAAAILAFSDGADAQAGTATGNLTVQITITASCSINAATLTFPSTAGTALLTAAVQASTTVSVTCTNGSPYAIGMGNGLNASGNQRRMINGASYLPYNLYTDSGYLDAWTTASSSTTCTTSNSCALGAGTGSAQSVNIYGAVPITAIAPAPGAYSDTVLMTITY